MVSGLFHRTEGPASHELSRTFSTLFISVFVTMLGLGIVIPLLPYYAESLGAGGIWIGAIFAGFSLSRAVVMPCIGRMSDLHGRRRFILSGLVLFSALSFVYVIADTVFALVAVRILHGIASAMVLPLAMAYIADLAPPGEEGIRIGTFTISMYLGMGLGPFIGGVLMQVFGIDAVFVVMGILSLLALVICAKSLPESGVRQVAARKKARFFSHPVLNVALVFQFMNAFATGTIFVFLPVIAVVSQNLSPGEIGFVVSANILTTALLQRFFGRLADRYPREILISAGMGTVAAGMVLIPYSPGFFGILALSLLVGVGSGVSIPAALAIATVAGRDIGQGTAMGALNMAMGAGMVVAPLVMGAVMDISGVTPVFLISGAISAGSTLMIFFMFRRAGAGEDMTA